MHNAARLEEAALPGNETAARSASQDERRAEVLDAARSGGWNLGGAAFNQLLRFGITLLLARLIGPTDVGLFYQAFAILTLLQLVGGGGLKLSLTRFVAVHRAEGDDAALHGSVRLGLAAATAGATAVGIALFATSTWFATALGDPRLTPLLQLVALALPPTVFTDCALSATQGFKTMRPYALVNLIFEPSLRILLTAALLLAGWGLSGVMVALVVTNYAASLLAALALRTLLGKRRVRARYHSLRELYSFTAVSWLTTLSNSSLMWADTILLGLYAGPSEVGVYQVSARLVLLGTIFIQPMTTSFAPRVADLYQRRRLGTLRDTYVLVTSWIFRLSLPAFIVLIAFPHELLAFFGPTFTRGATVTVLLAVGQLINSATGPCGYMLFMSGRQKLQTANNVGALLVNIALNLWLIPRHGMVGAAVSWAAVIAGFNLLRVVQVWRILGMLPIDRGLLKGAAAGGAALAVAALVQSLMSGFPALVVGGLAVALVYLAAIVFTGLGPDDRMVLDTLLRRLRSRTA